MSFKKIVSAALVLAMALTVVAPVAAGAQSMASAYSFTAGLKVGARGAAVASLQSFLESQGCLTMPAGVAKGYFGGLTKSAVQCFQAKKSLPTTGFFGPMSYAAAMASVSTPSTPTTGGTTTPAPTMGGVTFTNPGEGIVDVRLAATPADNANIQTSTDVSVYGLEFRARNADIAVQRVNLQVDVTANSASETPSTLINTVKVWDGSNVLATYPVSSGTFTKDSSNRYYIQLTGFNFLVPKDATKVLTVSFSTNSIDTNRTVTVKGYETSSVRAIDSLGTNTYYNASTLGRTHTFKKPGSSTLTLSSDPSILRSQNYKLSVTDGAQGVVLSTFNVKSETGASLITQVNASTTASGTLPTTLYLYDGSTLLSSKPVASTGGTISFDNLTVNVAQDQIKTLTIKADFSSATASGSAASTTVSSVVYDKPNGSSATVYGTVTGPAHYVFGAVPKITLSSITTSAPQKGGSTASSSSSQYVQAVFTFNVMANGGTLAKMSTSDFWIDAASSTAASSTITSVTTIPDRDIADGGTATVIVTARLNESSLAIGNVDYNFVVRRIAWGFTGTASTTQTWGLEDFRSGPVTGTR